MAIDCSTDARVKDHGLPALTDRFLAAMALAQEVHGHARREGTGIPYLAHLLVVAGLVVEDGGDEDQAIAALLHDAVEDGGGRALLGRIAAEFGPRVAAIVEGCSDSIDIDPAETWIARKRRYLAHLPDIEDDAILRVALADKVHNARSIVREYRESGQALWQRFKRKTAREQLWYYGGLLAFFQERRRSPLTEDLAHAVGELAWLLALEEARRTSNVRLWLDADLHTRQAPEGWIQVRTAIEAIQLLDELPVEILSLDGGSEGLRVMDWLIDQRSDGRDRWPSEQIAVRGAVAPRAWSRQRHV
jgi:(p)ppGpp synthase/HD superfamily hydrolase